MRSWHERLRLLGCGICMGAADLVPGISGGTVAFITGIYEELIHSVKNITKPSSWCFLFPLLFGILLSITTLAQLISYLLGHEVYRVLLYAGFFGLILASAWVCTRRVKKWGLQQLMGLLLACICAFMVTNLPLKQKGEELSLDVELPKSFTVSPLAENYDTNTHMLTGVRLTTLSAMLSKGVITVKTTVYDPMNRQHASVGDYMQRPPVQYLDWWVILCGAIGVSAMLLPGISGSYLLVILGMYAAVIGAVADLTLALRSFSFDWNAIFLLSNLVVGMALGALFFSQLVSWLFRHFHDTTIAMLIGFMLGAMRSVWPFWSYTYRILPLKPEKGIQLFAVDPLLPSIDSPILWISLAFAIGAFYLVFAFDKEPQAANQSDRYT